jgi:acetolactate synthase-1/2/3 large subunit
MADGYARVSGRPGVCFTITGPGLTNITTAMAQAYGDSIPLLVISSENRRAEIGTGRGYLHELIDQRLMASLVSGSAHRVMEPEALGPILREVFAALTRGRPRPAYIDIPRDVLALPAAEVGEMSLAVGGPPLPASADLEEAASRLRQAKVPVLLVGGGAIGAEITRLAEHLGAPVVMTVNARGLMPVDHPLAVPASPSLTAVRALVAAADVVLAIGTEFGQTDYDMYVVADFQKPRQLIRIDIDAAQMTRSVVPDLGLVGDAKEIVAALLSRDLGVAQPSRGQALAAAAAAAAFTGLSAAMQRQVGFLEVIRRVLPTAIMVGDSTQPVYAGNLYYAAALPRSWFNSGTGCGTLGYALPASTGAGLGAPDRPVVCLVGDGGIQFTLGELAVLRDVNAWTAIVVWNNHGYGEIRSSMRAVDIEPEGVDVRPPDFEPLAAAYGYGYCRIDSLETLERALRSFAAKRQVMMIEVVAEAFE